MNRINKLFATKSEKILSIYFCAGHPTLEGTVETIKTVIQDAATKALRNGMSLKKLFTQLEELHRSPLLTSPKGEENHPDSTSSPQSKEPCPNGKSSPLWGTGGGLPLILMGYLNPIMQFGFEKFCQRCVEVGIDGVIIPDLPFKDYLEEYKPVADKYDIRIIMLITPETRRPEASLLLTHQRHEPQAPMYDRFRHQQQTDARSSTSQCSRSHHRQQVCQTHGRDR